MKNNKILENAAMNDDELDKVAGGHMTEVANDSSFLYEHGLVDDYHGGMHTTLHWKSDSAAVDAGWAKAGITCVTKFIDDNLYFKDGKQITRDEAYNHVKANFKQIRDID